MKQWKTNADINNVGKRRNQETKKKSFFMEVNDNLYHRTLIYNIKYIVDIYFQIQTN